MKGNEMSKGLYAKYIVTKTETGEEVNDCFVLRPAHDPHAVAALKAYAESCINENPALTSDILYWLNEIEPEPEPDFDEPYRQNLGDDGS